MKELLSDILTSIIATQKYVKHKAIFLANGMLQVMKHDI